MQHVDSKGAAGTGYL